MTKLKIDWIWTTVTKPFKTASDIDWDWTDDTVFTNENDDWTKDLTITVTKNWVDQQAIQLKWVNSVQYVDLNKDWIKDLIAIKSINDTINQYQIYIFDNSKKQYIKVFDQQWITLKIKDFDWDNKLDAFLKWTNWKIKVYKNNNLLQFSYLTEIDWDWYYMEKISKDNYQDLVTYKKAWVSNWVTYYYYNVFYYNPSSKKYYKVLWPVLGRKIDYKSHDINKDWRKEILIYWSSSVKIYYYSPATNKYEYLWAVKEYSSNYIRTIENDSVILSFGWNRILFIATDWKVYYKKWNWKDYVDVTAWLNISTKSRASVKSIKIQDLLKWLTNKTFKDLKITYKKIEWEKKNTIIVLRWNNYTVMFVKPNLHWAKYDFLYTNKYFDNVNKINFTVIKSDDIYRWV